MQQANALVWDGNPGHYEVYYLTLTEPESGIGVWIRYTLLAPQADAPTCALWFLVTDPAASNGAITARKVTLPIEQLRAQCEPFELRVGQAVLSDEGMSGSFDDVEWELRWRPEANSYEHVHPWLQRLRVASSVLVLPNADLSIEGTIAFAGQRLELAGARGAQAHLWGRKHPSAWAWVHCNDLRTIDGEPRPGSFVDGLSAIVTRFGREVGPATPVLARVAGREFRSTSPARVLTNPSTFALTGWSFEASDGALRLVGQVDADRDQLAGVTYHDPDGEPAYCYNSETATMRLHVYERARQLGGWALAETLVGPGCAHFEYAQREPVPELRLYTT